MKIYAIADKTSQCYGHGDYGDELRICRHGRTGYGTGDFPPVFRKREQAKKYLGSLEPYKSVGMEIVKMELR